jgi:hypothetical protein
LVAAKNLSWNAVDTFSTFQNKFGPVFPVPRHSFSMLLDVLQWPFLILPAPLALSMYWTCFFGAAIFGWRLLLGKLGVKPWLSWSGAVLLFFNAYQQAWLTVLGTDLLVMPIICLSAIQSKKNPISYLVPFFVGAIAMSSTSYIPGIVAVIYGTICVGLVQIISARLILQKFVKNLFFLGIGLVTPIALRFQEFRQLSKTIYPGERWGTGGGTSVPQWLSQMFPTLVYTGWHDLLKSNTCEAATVGTVLPIFLICYSFFEAKKFSLRQNLKNYEEEIILFIFFFIFSYWQLLGFPKWLSNLTLLGHMGATRTLMVSGSILLILSLKLMSKIEFKPPKAYAALGLTGLTVLFLGTYFSEKTKITNSLPTVQGLKKIYTNLLVHDDWLSFGLFLSSITLFVFLPHFITLVSGKKIIKTSQFKIIFISTVVLPNVLIWGTFNPIYSADKIFSINSTQAAKHSKDFFSITHKSVILPGELGPINWLADVYIRSPQAGEEVPPIKFWRDLLGPKYEKYSAILNRYAYIEVGKVDYPSIFSPDYIVVPVKWFLNNNKFIVPDFDFSNSKVSDYSLTPLHRIACGVGDGRTQVDSLSQAQEGPALKVVATGWLNDSNIRNYSILADQLGNKNLKITSVTRQTRFDVLTRINFPSAVSGYTINLENVIPGKCLNINFYPN